jgi:hypothetical protein
MDNVQKVLIICPSERLDLKTGTEIEVKEGLKLNEGVESKEIIFILCLFTFSLYCNFVSFLFY